MNRQATPEQVDATIWAVLREFGWAGGTVCAEVVEQGDIFSGRLLALRHIETLGQETREIRIAPGTVVTPLARDLLKRLKIRLRLVSDADVLRQRREGEWGFAIEDTSGTSGVLRRALLSDPEAWREVGNRAIDAARWVAESTDRGAVVFTPEASLACWLAARIEGVRSAAPADADAVARAVRHLGANLLVFESSRHSLHSLKHECRVFRRNGAPTPPEGLEALLRKPSDNHADRRDHWSDHVIESSSEYSTRPVPHRPSDAHRGAGRGLASTW
ncbi:hypothetical protein BH23PLA1_BH23PLA1_01960 [soil metagenome]